MATKKEVYKVYFLLAVLFLLIVIAWKTHQRSKVPSGVFKDPAIVDLHYRVFSPVPPGNSEEVEPTEDPWETEQHRRKALVAKVCRENQGKTHMTLDPDRCLSIMHMYFPQNIKDHQFSGSCTMTTPILFGVI